MKSSNAPAQPTLVRLQQRLRRRVRRGGLPATDLFAHLVDPANLTAAWQRVAASSGAETAGPDGSRCRDWNGCESARLRQLASELNGERYRCHKPRRVDVAKSSGGFRRLGILAVRDRVVHAACKQVLEPLLEPLFHDRSYGFRPRRSVATAVRQAISHLNRGAPRLEWAVGLDVVQCFDRIRHSRLLSRLETVVDDSRMLDLLRHLFTRSSTHRSWLWSHPQGLLQGSSLSPLLCNWYLHPLDEACDACPGRDRAVAFRYADDLLLLADSRSAARRAIRRLRRAAHRQGLALTTKDQPLTRIRDGAHWLGWKLAPRSNTTEFGCFIPDARVTRMRKAVREMTDLRDRGLPDSAIHLPGLLAAVNARLEKWANYYRAADNAREVFTEIDRCAFGRVAKLLESTSGCRGHALRKRFLVRRGRAATWRVEEVDLVSACAIVAHGRRRLARHDRTRRNDP